MGKDKLKKFAEIATFPNVFQLEEGTTMKGNWALQHFRNTNPIVLELACGKGEYTVNLAKNAPERNFIGVDFKGNRLWQGAKTALEENLTNVAFLRIRIEDILDYFAEGEIDEIWITFPDPQPQKGRIKKRLTNPVFLAKYRAITKAGARLHLKTDNDDFYQYTMDVLNTPDMVIDQSTHDLYSTETLRPELLIKTYYEKKYLQQNKNINYVQWTWSTETE